MYIFDRQRIRKHRNRAASQFGEHDFLLKEMALRLDERLSDFNKTFPAALDLGAHTGLMAEMLKSRGATLLVQSDLSFSMLSYAEGHKVICDEEFLPFAHNSFDLVVSGGSLHWVNDLPGTLIQIQRTLKPGGLFLAVMPGGETLKELRQSFEQAEIALTGGVSPRISPFIDVRDAAGLLQRAGFSMPVADSDTLTIEYTHPLELMKDLHGAGESSALIEGRKTFTSRALMAKACDHYLKHFSNDAGRIVASAELVTLTGIKV